MSIDKALVQKIPLLTVGSGPRDAQWIKRLEQEFASLIKVRLSFPPTLAFSPYSP